nr:PREDICTED: cysteine-rich and transmembrane domain-containing protein A-like isoform X1 [Musa acuminata subsp. malaccensis]
MLAFERDRESPPSSSPITIKCSRLPSSSPHPNIAFEMSYYPQQQQAPPQAYPPPPSSHPSTGQAYPPAGYPSRDGAVNPQQVPIETKSRGDGFWRGCCAALCCCCVLDMCF